MDRIDATALSEIVAFLLTAAGADPAIAGEVAANLVEADLLAHHSHGARQTGSYVDRLLKGILNGRERPVIVSNSPSLIRINGRRMFGQVVGAFAAAEGARAAKRQGVAVVAVNDSGHFGRNGKWPEIAAAEGVASIHFVNAPDALSSVAPFGGSAARLNSNPIALGAPQPDGNPVIVDFSVAEVAVNVIKLAHERGEPLPKPCIVRADGSLTDDPSVFVSGAARAILPFGGFKGYALAVFAEIFAGAIGGGGCHTREPEVVGGSRNNMLSIYIDAAAFAGSADYDREIEGLSDWIRGSADGHGNGAAMPGDRGWKARADQAGSVAFDDNLRSILAKAADRAGVLTEARHRWPEIFKTEAVAS